MMLKKNVNGNSLKWYPKTIGSPFKKLLEKKNENLHYWKKKVTSQPLMGL